MQTRFSRRDFLKGSIVLALGAAGAGALGACSAPRSDSAAPAQDGSAPAATGSPDASKTVTLHRGYGAVHGDKCFTAVVVATADDGTILGASVDDYQFMAADTKGLSPVPNSDAGLKDGYASGQVLMSKMQNNDLYSAAMKEKAQATLPWLASMQAIEAYCVGKKAADLTKAGMDAVSGATLVDGPNYLKLVSEVAGSGDVSSSGSYAGDGSDLKLGRANATGHGTKSFVEAVSLVQGDTVVAASIDEFEFADATSVGLKPVPNSDKGLGAGYASGKALMSKAVNSDLYSAKMKEKAKSTMSWIESMSAIESYAAGKKVDEVQAKGPDAVSGATLVDTANYLKAAQAAAKAV